jgi:hypothetical protein
MEDPHFIYDPEHWRLRAKEARSLAEGFADLSAKDTMLKIAQGYEDLAERAARRAVAK